jgi:hypothetical protein
MWSKLFSSVLLLLAFSFFFYSSYRAVIYYGNMTVCKMWKPKLVCEQFLYDFGKITSPENRDYEFVFYNRGWGKLTIESISPGCGACVKVAGYTEGPIPHGESGAVTLTLLTQYLKGKVSKEALVQTNDPKNPNLILTLEAEVIRPDEERTDGAISSENVSTTP